MDPRGYSDSEKPPTGFTIKQFSEDLIALADKLSIEKPLWVGVSMGGMILQQLALDHPERVGALVLVSTTDGAMVVDRTCPPSETRARLSGRLAKHPRGKFSAWHPARALSAAAGPHSDLERHGAARGPDQHGPGERPRPVARDLVPPLVIVGAKDDVATPAIARGIHSQIAGSKLGEFQTGHFMMAEDPERFRTVLRDFLRSLK